MCRLVDVEIEIPRIVHLDDAPASEEVGHASSLASARTGS
jgi:hypothetical protein